LDVINVVKNAFYLALNIKDDKRLELVKAETKRLVTNFNPQSSSRFALRANLIGLMTKEKDAFSKEDLDSISNSCLEYSKELQDSHKIITMLELGEIVDQKLGISTCNWKKSIAETFEKMMTAHMENKLVAITFCQNALKYYREIKDTKN
jgi:hypothetical protein